MTSDWRLSVHRETDRWVLPAGTGAEYFTAQAWARVYALWTELLNVSQNFTPDSPSKTRYICIRWKFRFCTCPRCANSAKPIDTHTHSHTPIAGAHEGRSCARVSRRHVTSGQKHCTRMLFARVQFKMETSRGRHCPQNTHTGIQVQIIKLTCKLKWMVFFQHLSYSSIVLHITLLINTPIH